MDDGPSVAIRQPTATQKYNHSLNVCMCMHDDDCVVTESSVLVMIPVMVTGD